MKTVCSRGWCRWFVVLVAVLGHMPSSGAGTLEEDRALLVEWLTGGFVSREKSSFMDEFVGEEIIVDGLGGERAIWVDETFDGVAHELYGDQIKDWVKIRSFGSTESEDLPGRMLKNVGLSTYGVRTFALDPESGSILMREWYPTPDGRLSLDEQPAPTGKRRIDVASLTEYQGCATRFRLQGDEFIGVPAEGPCTFNIKDGTIGIERRWRITAEAFDVTMIYRRLDSQDATSARLSALYRFEPFEILLTDLKWIAFGNIPSVAKRIHDQNGSVDFGPVILDGETLPDVSGTGSPRFVVTLDREPDSRVLTGAHKWADGTTEEAFEIGLPLDVHEFNVEFANARLEMRAPRSMLSAIDELADLFTGSFSNLAQVDGNRYLEVELHVARIWTHRTDHRWFYVEMVNSLTPDEPVLQRVVRTNRGRDGSTVKWYVHKLTDPEAMVGLWKEPGSLGNTRGQLRPVSSPCILEFWKRGDAWVSTSIRQCGPDPVEAFIWRLAPDQIRLMRSAYTAAGKLGSPRGLLILDRID